MGRLFSLNLDRWARFSAGSRVLLVLTVLVSSAFGLDLRFTRVASGLSQPVDIQSARDGSGRLFLVEQAGRILIYRGGSVQPSTFLDIRTRVRFGGERGLLGLAFPPGFPQKRHFYVNYSNRTGDTVIARFRLSADPDRADPASEQIVLLIEQPFPNHNGGQLRFGPDGYLYIGTGDGGSAGDPNGNGQARLALLGKMLRIDVESDLAQYRIPPSNPFSGDPSFRPEIWALGLRNPWRFSFDRATGDLWIADVGQNRAEEINFQPAAGAGGANYGWNIMEGLECFRAPCDSRGLTLPILEYGRAQGVSVTGGHVYRGTRSPGLRGVYLYADFASGRLWGIRPVPPGWRNSLLAETSFLISTFGEDEAGEIYLADYGGGAIYRVDATGALDLAPEFIVNGASFAPGLTPGSAATVFVAGVRDDPGVTTAGSLPLPRSLGDVQVFIDGQAAPLYAVASVGGAEQVNFQAPFEIASRQDVTVKVVRQGVFESSASVPVLPFQPGIFTTAGGRAVVVHHATNTLITGDAPLARGEFAYFYATGLGAVAGGPVAGDPAPANPPAHALSLPTVTLGGAPCEVLFAGLAPGFAGVYQVNIRVPGAAAAGLVALEIRSGGLSHRADTLVE